VYDPVRRRSKLRYFLDLPARIDNDGTKDRLQRAKCIVRDDNSMVEKRVGVREVHGNSCLVRQPSFTSSTSHSSSFDGIVLRNSPSHCGYVYHINPTLVMTYSDPR
jgi:hypothetical protein